MQWIGAAIATVMLAVICSALLTAPVAAAIIILRRRASGLIARVVMSTAQIAAATLVLYATKYSQLLGFWKPSLADIAGDSALVALCGGIGWAIASALVPPAVSPSGEQSRNRRLAMTFLTIYVAFVSVVVLAMAILVIFAALSTRQQPGLAAVSFGISEALVEIFIVILLIAGVWWLRSAIVRHRAARKL
jgi:uncharacterized membrane protein YozB (DUF420 family)